MGIVFIIFFNLFMYRSFFRKYKCNKSINKLYRLKINCSEYVSYYV